VVLNNINADARMKVAKVAYALKPWNIKVYLTARFSSPIGIGSLKRSDPYDTEVISWWKTKTHESYHLIPDFSGFLVKANSEGQPEPQNYNRSHADGANILADALTPNNGIVMWRAFVYDQNVPDNPTKQAYSEFQNLNGKFRKNVLIQVKNGPLDFQPREPFHPLFGAMPQTSVMAELYSGVDSVYWMEPKWRKIRGSVDEERFELVLSLIEQQEKSTEDWRDACLLYFQTFSNKSIPDIYQKPQHDLEFYKNLIYTFETTKPNIP